ncbi:MAG: hypothetical protein QG568_638 [Patescibacteria group bacterium]|nr:hypothetical protein [Patescibacteria group bacterium]
MKGISDFLAKFKVIPNPADEKKIIVSIINSIIEQDLQEDIVDVRGYSINLNIHPALKGLLFQNKEAILKQINERFNGEKTFKNIG